MITIDADRCTGCGMCRDECDNAALFNRKDGSVAVDSAKCTECGRCIGECPNEAISEVQ